MTLNVVANKEYRKESELRELVGSHQSFKLPRMIHYSNPSRSQCRTGYYFDGVRRFFLFSVSYATTSPLFYLSTWLASFEMTGYSLFYGAYFLALDRRHGQAPLRNFLHHLLLCLSLYTFSFSFFFFFLSFFFFHSALFNFQVSLASFCKLDYILLIISTPKWGFSCICHASVHCII